MRINKSLLTRKTIKVLAMIMFFSSFAFSCDTDLKKGLYSKENKTKYQLQNNNNDSVSQEEHKDSASVDSSKFDSKDIVLRELRGFNPDFIDHFPKFGEAYILFTMSMSYILLDKELITDCFTAYEAIVITRNDKENYNKIKNKYSKNAKAIYKSNRDDLLLVFSYSNEYTIGDLTVNDGETPEKRELANHNLTKAKSLPIPLFEDIDKKFFKGETMCGLNEKYELVVLDAKPGKYLSDEYYKFCGKCLPDEWEHGFSKGLAFNDEDTIIIYWVTVW